MEARICRVAFILGLAFFALGASHRTPNFIISAETPEFARQVGEWAEKYRRELAIEWTGRELRPWHSPCPIRVQDGPELGAGGMTSFYFDRGQPRDFQMSIQGSQERILDSVLPHEVTHTIFATHFGRPLPRWADEGACTTVEHASEKDKQHRLLYEFLTTGRGIAFNNMFAMKEYPRDILPLYAQGFSLSKFLIAQGGKRKFMEYVGEGMNTNNWPSVTKKHYGFKDLSELQTTWVAWVGKGCPAIGPKVDVNPSATTIVSAEGVQPATNLVPLQGVQDAPGSGTVTPNAPAHEHLAALPLAAGAAGSMLSQRSVQSVAATANPTQYPQQPYTAQPAPVQPYATTAAPVAIPGEANWNAKAHPAAAASRVAGNPLRSHPEAPPVTPAANLQWNQPAVSGGYAAAPAGYGQPIGSLPPNGPQPGIAPVGYDSTTPQAVSRPQPAERPREIILEWSRGGQTPNLR